MRALIIGSQDEFLKIKPHTKDIIYEYSGLGNEQDTIVWTDLVIRKNIKPTFSNLFIIRYNSIFTVGGKLDPRRLYSFLKVLKEGGKVWLLCDFGESYKKISEKLKLAGYNEQTDIVHEHRKWLTFSDTPKLISKPIERKIEKVAESPPRKVYIPRQLSRVDVTKPKNTGKYVITVKEFRKYIDDPEFISSFVSSQKELLKHKVSFYSSTLSELKLAFALLQKKITSLRVKNVPDTLIREKYPNYELYAMNIAEIECLIDVISKRKILGETTKANLIDALENPEKGLESLIGLDEIKNDLVTKLYSFGRCYKSVTKMFHNLALMGAAGSGKTSLAKVVAYLYSKSGILATDIIKIISRADIVGSYIGQTAPRTKGLLMECLEGVLFVDEAYQLVPEEVYSGKDYGLEAIAEFVNFLDKYIGMSIVIVAGYEKPMKTRFFPSNEGLDRRFPVKIVLKKYSAKELTQILVKFLEETLEESYPVTDEIANYLYSCVLHYYDYFSSSAGDMLNIGNLLIAKIFVRGWENYSSIIHSTFAEYV